MTRSQRMALAEVLIDHEMALTERRLQRTRTTWPDESDIFTGTILRLRTMIRKFDERNAGAPPDPKEPSE